MTTFKVCKFCSTQDLAKSISSIFSTPTIQDIHWCFFHYNLLLNIFLTSLIINIICSYKFDLLQKYNDSFQLINIRVKTALYYNYYSDIECDLMQLWQGNYCFSGLNLVYPNLLFTFSK